MTKTTNTAKTVKTTKATARKSRKSTQSETLFKMETGMDLEHMSITDGIAALEAMAEPTEIVEAAEPAGPVDGEITLESAEVNLMDDSLLDGINMDELDAEAAKVEATAKVYAEQSKELEVDALFKTAADAPVTEEVSAEQPAKAKKVKTAGEKKEPKEPKAFVPRYTNSKKSEVLSFKLGEKAGETLILEITDAALEGAELKAKMDEVLEAVDKCSQKKVAEKAVMLFKWMAQGGKLNEVMARAFKVMARDGELTSGDKGNLHADLLAKPFSVGTARAQGGQIFCLFPMLKIAIKDAKGHMVPNPDSAIWLKARGELSL